MARLSPQGEVYGESAELALWLAVNMNTRISGLEEVGD
jgi:hypothetical protein